MREAQRFPLLIQGVSSDLQRRGYTLKEQLSEPGTHGNTNSVVWLAEKEGTPVALKISSYGLMDSYEGDNIDKLKEFVGRERTTLKQAGNHPNIPGFMEAFDIFHEEGAYTAYVTAMQYLAADPISSRMNLGMRLSEEENELVLRDCLSGLSHLHKIITAHRDIKPENIYVNGERAYLSDFGIVTLDGKESGTTLMNVYYPIDIFDRDGQRPSQDLVALGNVSIAGGLAKSIDRIRFEQGKDGLAQVNVDELPYSEGMRQFLGKLTASPKNRFQTAQEALNGLEKLTKTPSLPVSLDEKSPKSLEEIASGELDSRAQEIQEPMSLEHRTQYEGLPKKKGDGTYTAVKFNLINSKVGGDAKLNAAGLGAVVGGDAKLNAAGGFADVGGDAKLNAAGFGAVVYGNAKLTAAGICAVVGGDAKLNAAGIGAVVGGDAKLNAAGGLAYVDGNAKLNAAGIGAVVGGTVEDFTLEDIAGRFGRYVPRFLRDIAIPGLNAGMITHIGGTDNAYIFGLFNNIERKTQGDYIALGLINRIKQEDGSVKWRPGLSYQVSIDGIFKHRNQEG